MTFSSQISHFWLFVNDKVGDGDKISKENFGPGRPRFHANSRTKTPLKAFLKSRIAVIPVAFICK